MSRPVVVTFVCAATVVLATWNLIDTVRNRPEPPPDMVAPAVAAYRSLGADLPASGPIGFIATGPNDTYNTANYYIAQYALAPRVVLDPFASVDYVVTGVSPPAAIDQDLRLRGFELAAVRGQGVRIYRRMVK